MHLPQGRCFSTFITEISPGIGIRLCQVEFAKCRNITGIRYFGCTNLQRRVNTRPYIAVALYLLFEGRKTVRYVFYRERKVLFMIEGVADEMFEVKLHLPKSGLHCFRNFCFLVSHFTMMVYFAYLVLLCQLRDDLSRISQPDD